VGPVWFSAHGFLFLGYAFVGGVRVLTRLGERVAAGMGRPRRPTSEPEWPDPADSELDLPPLSRRAFLQRTSLAGAAIPFGVSISGVGTSYDFRVEERDVELPHWPRALDGFRIAHLSDIHVGGAMDRERLLRIAELTNAARADLVAHTGDFLTHRSGDFDAPLYEALAKIEAPYGQWACLGNHDFDDPELLVRLLGDSGVRVLRDQLARLSIEGEAVEIAGLDYLSRGVDWESGYRRLLASLGAREGAPRILLNHDPTAFVRLPAECADLVLSGHTHGGHVGVQLGRNHAITVVGLLGLPDQGTYRRGDMRLYVTRCVGFYGYPMRIGIPPEIALLRLRAPVPLVSGPSSTET
jgi:predicted MPP superfamily phosphohydrolase